MDKLPTKSERYNIYMNTYNSKNEKDIKKAYKQWSSFYEYHIIDMGWDAPKLISDLLLKYLNGSTILDIGCGTGLVGKELKIANYVGTIDGLDLSLDMINEAKKKNIYNNFLIMNAESMNIPDNTYDGITCVGSLNFGHIMPSAYKEFLRVIKVNGLICFSTREDYYLKVSKKEQDFLEKEGYWELVEKKYYKTKAVTDMPHYHWLYKKMEILH